MTGPGAHEAGIHGRILVVDDDAQLRSLWVECLRLNRYEAVSAPGGESALHRLSEQAYDLVISDICMPDLDGGELLRWMNRRQPDVPVVLITGLGDVRQAVDMMKLGAYDYLVKPVTARRLLETVGRAIGPSLPRAVPRPLPLSLVGGSRAIRRALRRALAAAADREPVLLVGEQGTGREEVARAIHRWEPRHAGQLSNLDASDLSPGRLRAELAALRSMPGQDTCFLDRVECLPGPIQDELWTILQSVRERGGEGPRFIAGSHPGLEDAVATQAFSPALYASVSVHFVELPALHERPGDLALLAEALVREQSAARKKRLRLSPRSLEILCAQSWPDNIDGLRAAIAHAGALAQRSVIRPVDLGPGVGRDERSGMDHLALRSEERRCIEQALEHSRGNKSKAARILGISRATLYRKLREYGLKPD